ncbi:MAG: nodulation protein NodJ [Myxococcales bacterium]|nr:nodulation protein NodJ [Myxococcales bacterium]
MKRLARSWRVCLRHLYMWRQHAGASLAGNVAEPLLYLLILGFGMGEMMDRSALPEGMNYRLFYGSGLIASVAMMSASFENLFGAFTRMMGQRTYEAMIATPISLSEVLVGDAMYAAIKASLASLAVPVVLVVVGEPVSPMILLGLPATVILAFFFGSAALVVMAHSPDYGWFNYYITLVLTPMFLFSGVFFPLEIFGPYAEAARIVPLSIGVEIQRSLVLGQVPPMQSIILTLTLLPGLSWLFLRLARRKLQQRLIG